MVRGDVCQFEAAATFTPAASFHPEIAVGDETTRVMCEMVGWVDAQALAAPAGHLTLDEMRRVDEALELVLVLELG